MTAKLTPAMGIKLINNEDLVGPICFTRESVDKRIDDFITGRKVFWFGQTPFKKTPIY